MEINSALVKTRKPSEDEASRTQPLDRLRSPLAPMHSAQPLRPTRTEGAAFAVGSSRLAHMLAELEAHAEAALDSVRSIVRGIYPALLADFGLAEALRAQARRAALRVSVIGGVPRGTQQAEEAVYFSCSEAIQNAAKHAGPAARVTLWLHHHDRTLRALVTDDGRGFDPARTPEGAGLQNIRDRVEGLGGSFNVASRPGLGTVLTISLPWPPTANCQR